MPAKPANSAFWNTSLRIRKLYVAGLREGCMLRVEGDRLSLIGNRPMRIFRCGTQPFEVHPDEDLSFLM